MSEEERKEEHKMPRIVSIIPLIAGIATFLSAFMVYIGGIWLAITPFPSDFDFIAMFLTIVAFIALCAFLPLVAVGFVLTIVALFTLPNKGLPLAGLIFVLLGVCLFLASYAL